MERETIEKWIVTYVTVFWLLMLPETGYTPSDTDNLWPHLAYMWSHANGWHLAGNLFVLWILKSPLHLTPALMIAFLASFVPAFSLYGDMGMTLGFSGVIFAIIGIKWGLHCGHASSTGSSTGRRALRDFALKALPFALIGILIPHINWCVHLYCMLAGFIYGRCRR